jgi:hypothetical protein
MSHLCAVLLEVPCIADQGGYYGSAVEAVQEENGLNTRLRQCFVGLIIFLAHRFVHCLYLTPNSLSITPMLHCAIV